MGRKLPAMNLDMCCAEMQETECELPRDFGCCDARLVCIVKTLSTSLEIARAPS